MAKAVKGCMKPECISHEKRINYSLNHDYCPKCGQRLSYVCKDCRMELDDDSKRYCVRCENRRKDRKEQMGKVLLEKVGEGGKAVAGFVGDVADDMKKKANQRAAVRKAKKTAESKMEVENEKYHG